MLSSNVLKVENIDKMVGEETDDKENNQIHDLLPRHPARILICGTSGAGKSNLLSVMILKQLVYDKIYVFSKHLEQKKYSYLKNHIEGIEEMFKKKYNLNTNIIEAWESDLTKLPTVEKLDKDYRNLIVIDDFAISSKKEMDRISDLFVRGRHRSTSIIFLTQLYFKCSRDIKLNTTHIILFQSYNKRELISLTTDLGSDLPKGKFKEMYNRILSKNFQFFLIDNTTNDIDRRYRSSWDGLGEAGGVKED